MTSAAAGLDVNEVRTQFPALSTGVSYFDGAGGTQTPEVVGNAIRRTLLSPLSNRGTTTAAERNADQAVIECRSAMADFMNVDAGTVVFGRSMTALTFAVSRALAATWEPGDEIVLTRLEHDANVRPWVIAARRAGVTVRWVDFDPVTTELDMDGFAPLLKNRPKLVAVTAASNLTGTIPDVVSITEAAREAGAVVFVDGVQYSAHELTDVTGLGADLFTCSPYKFFGPHCGVLAGRREVLEMLQPDKLLPGPNSVPERFELGTLPYELMAGTTATVNFLASLVSGGTGSRRQRLVHSIRAMRAHEHELCARLEEGISRMPGVTLYMRAARRTPTILVTFAGHKPSDVSRFLAARQINVSAGSFYGYEPCRVLKLGDEGALRITVSLYNNVRDVERLLEGLNDYFEGVRAPGGDVA